jgi:peptidoglycan/LPS O-acetylase OafA/YrhL
VANLPYSVYAHSDFWRNSPALILIRVGISLLLLAGAYLWTQFGARAGWSWMQNLGKTSLLVYWVHVMLVYGDIVKPLKRALTVPQAALATVVVTMLMVALSETRLRWKERRLERWRAGTTVAGAAEA